MTGRANGRGSRGARRAAAVVALTVLVPLLAGCAANNVAAPMCTPESSLPERLLVAQSIPDASLVPCIEVFPAGWNFGGMTVAAGETVFTLDNDRGGFDAMKVTMTPVCAIGDARPQQVQGDEIGTTKYVRPIETGGRILPATAFYRYPGACVTVEYRLAADAPSSLFAEAGTALSFLPRSEIVAETSERIGEILCGAEAPPCPG
ncbi:MAG: hypothetical protein WEA10_10535 [Actinomycetota bacterium]